MATAVSKTDLINRFTTRVRDYITSQTNWVSGTVVWNTTVGAVTAGSAGFGGPYSRTADTTNVAGPAMTTASIPNRLSTATSASNTVVTVLRDFLVSWANNHRVTLQNTGNLTPASYVGTVKLNDLVATTKNLIISDVNTLAVENNLVANKRINQFDLDGFIDDCVNVWINRCFTTPPEIFYYGFCHSSCHSNHSSHGSRGRR